MLRQGEQHIMQFMQMLKASLVPRRSIIATVVMVGVVASVMGLMPTHGASNTLAENCANPPVTPTFNYWPVTYSDVNTPFCHDFPAIDATKDGSTHTWSQSEAQWNSGLTLNVGDNGIAGMYIHNGAANNLDPAQTTAKNVHIITHTDTTPGTDHQISVTYKADNAASYTKSFTVHTPANAQLVVTPNSGFMYDYQGHLVLDSQNLNLGNSDYALGDLDACFEYSLFLTFKFKVIGNTPSNTTLTLTKGVKNITNGTGYSSNVTAVHGDKVGYQVVVKNNGNTVAKNVTVTDNGTSGISIDSGSTAVRISDNVETSNLQWSGSIPGTVTLGDLQPGEFRNIFYTGTVTADNCPTLTNTATATSSTASTVTATASVTVQNNCNSSQPHIDITKSVKNTSTGTSYNNDSVDARTGERVMFKVVVSNNGSTTLNNVIVTDTIPSGLTYDDSFTGSGSKTFSGRTLTVDLGSISNGSSKTFEFAATVDATGNTTVCNTARATASGVNQVQDNACVNVFTTPKGGNPHLTYSKRAFNDTQNVDATSRDANRGDYITYSLVVTNNGDADQTNFVIKDDLSEVLPLVDMVSTNGGQVSGNFITYPSITIKKGETVVKTFKVRVKQTLDKTLSYQLRNTYGNTVVINVHGTRVYQAPKTGAAGTSAAVFAGLVTAGFVLVRKRKGILSFIFA